MAVAMDAQGASAVRPFVTGLENAFPVLVDSENVLGSVFGFKAIPNGILVGVRGEVDSVVAGGFDIRRPETRTLVDEWAAGRLVPVLQAPSGVVWSPRALDLFQRAVRSLQAGEREEAIRLLKLSYPLDPDNYIIRKQLWAVENPERFYSGDIDKVWQQAQLDAGR